MTTKFQLIVYVRFFFVFVPSSGNWACAKSQLGAVFISVYYE